MKPHYNRTDVQTWIDDDPDSQTADEVRRLLRLAEAGNPRARTELADRFAGLLEFGTAGLRGALAGGPNRMNRAVVMRAAYGLAQYLRSVGAKNFRVVVGYDGRHRSEQFAFDTAAVLQAAGGHVLLFDSPTPTPLVAFALRDLGADAAVMVTASHNPREDNGYKVYLGGQVEIGEGQGAQIIAPADKEIRAAMQASPQIASIPRTNTGWEMLGEEVTRRYLRRLHDLIKPGPRDLRVVFTALHGVAGQTALNALTEAGFRDVHVVTEQQSPDPDFPTVDFPNPEEPGALNLATRLARQVGADLIVATDPDGDRCGAAIPDRNEISGWRQLTGNEIGAILGEQAAKQNAGCQGATLANSLVSSRLLKQIATHYGVGYRRTLTGFKWICRVPGLVYGFEEALGYCTDPNFVRDKDGISAVIKLAALAAEQKFAGKTLQSILDDQALTYGCYLSEPITIKVADPQKLALMVEHLRGSRLTSLAGSPVTVAADLSSGYEGLPSTVGMLYLTAADDQVVVRPSGTEPKLKCYLEVIIPVEETGLETARAAGKKRLREIKNALLQSLELPLPEGV